MTPQPSDQEDIILIERIATGDAAAFRVLADKYMLRSLRFVERMVGNREHAEDVVQEAFEAVWKQASSWRPTAKFSTWFHQVLVNLTNNRYRDRHRYFDEMDDVVDDVSASVEERLISGQNVDAVKAALLELPERQRLAIVLFYYEDMSQKEACEIMKVSEGAFESLLSRARAFLKNKLEKIYH